MFIYANWLLIAFLYMFKRQGFFTFIVCINIRSRLAVECLVPYVLIIIKTRIYYKVTMNS